MQSNVLKNRRAWGAPIGAATLASAAIMLITEAFGCFPQTAILHYNSCPRDAGAEDGGGGGGGRPIDMTCDPN